MGMEGKSGFGFMFIVEDVIEGFNFEDYIVIVIGKFGINFVLLIW